MVRLRKKTSSTLFSQHDFLFRKRPTSAPDNFSLSILLTFPSVLLVFVVFSGLCLFDSLIRDARAESVSVGVSEPIADLPESDSPVATPLPTPEIANPLPPQTAHRVIEAIFVVEALPNETNEQADSRIRPVIAVANLFLEPIGFILRAKRLELTPSLPGATLMEVVRNLHEEWRNNTEERNIVIGIVPTLRADAKMGIAFPFTSCQTSNAISAFVGMSDSADHINRTGQTLAHEIGHFLGAGHDARSVVENGLFSIMHPMALASVGGFSDISREEIEGYAGESQDGGKCFRSEVVETPEIRIEGPEAITIHEGETILQNYAVVGAKDPVVLRVSQLPYGMFFDVVKAQFQFSPDYSMADPKSGKGGEVLIHLSAETFSLTVEKTILVHIEDVPRPPVFSDGNLTTLFFGKNKKISYGFSVSSPDGTIPTITCVGVQKSLKLKIAGNLVQLSGKLKATQGFSCSSANAEGVSTKVVTFSRALKNTK